MYQVMTMGQMARLYSVDVRTFKKMVSAFLPDLRRAERSYMFTAKQVEQIFLELGEPEEIKSGN